MSPQTLRERAEVRLGPEDGPEFQIAPMIEMRVLIRADRDVRYDFMRALMIAVGKAGVGNVEFAVVDRNPYPDPTH